MIAVGVGPGDPELLTLTGTRLLREADVAAGIFSINEPPTCRWDRPLTFEEDKLRRTVYVKRVGLTGKAVFQDL